MRIIRVCICRNVMTLCSDLHNAILRVNEIAVKTWDT